MEYVKSGKMMTRSCALQVDKWGLREFTQSVSIKDNDQIHKK